MSKSKFSLRIMEQDYILVGEEDQEEYYLDLAQKVDNIMREISRSNNRYNVNMVAVLTALNLADALYKTQVEYADASEKLESLQSEMQKPFEELSSLTKELEAVKEQYNKTQIEYTKNQIDLAKTNREWSKAQEEMKDLTCELDVSKQAMEELQNKLFENQIELLKIKKELDEYKSRSGNEKGTVKNFNSNIRNQVK